jgi:hypothetical protein
MREERRTTDGGALEDGKGRSLTTGPGAQPAAGRLPRGTPDADSRKE